jgi:DNA polymerase-4
MALDNDSISDALQPWHGKAILLVDLDAFFASVEQLDHPEWRGKPVIVGGDADKHGVVSTASYEARKFGVHSAMAAATARRLCPQAIWTHGHFDRYREMSHQVMDILLDESPFLQQVSIDEAFLDVSSNLDSAEHPVLIAQRIQRRVSELGVSCSVGIGTSKTVAKVASERDKPRGLTVVYPGRELAFLAPLKVRELSGVGKRAEKVLNDNGIYTLGEMAEAPDAVLQKIYGKNADMMRQRCLGRDVSPVAQDDSVKSVSNETTLSEDLTTFRDISNTAASMAAKVARRLRKKGLRGFTITLKLRFADRSLHTAQTQLREPCDNASLMQPVIDELIRKAWTPGVPVRLVGVGVSNFADEDSVVQGSLFDTAELEDASDGPTSQQLHYRTDDVVYDAVLAEEVGAGSNADGRADGSTAAGAQPSRHADVGDPSGHSDDPEGARTAKARKTAASRADAQRRLADATDRVKDRFGDSAVFLGRDIDVSHNTTGTGAKNG